MPYMMKKSGDKVCVHKQNADGSAGAQMKCYGSEQEAKDYMAALYKNVGDAAKLEHSYMKAITDAPNLRGDMAQCCMNCAFYQMISGDTGLCNKYQFAAESMWVCDSWQAYEPDPMPVVVVKAAGDWELDVLSAPFIGKDSDKQFFDSKTNFMLDNYPTPPVIYFHGLDPSAKRLASEPVIVGKAVGHSVQPDGVHTRVVLDKGVPEAGKIWEASKAGKAVASTGSLPNIARMDVGGKLVPYDKHIPGRIAIWPIGELSLWDEGGTWANASSRYAIATPVMKSHYEKAGLTFPNSSEGNDTGTEDAQDASVAARRSLQYRARALLTTLRRS